MAHDTYTHASDGRTCILADGYWFVPLDAGGEGYDCEREHGPTALLEDEDGAPFPDEVQGTRRFFLHRTGDVTGVHEDGVIAVGVQFADSTTVLNWLPGKAGGAGSVAVWPSFADVVATHLHPRSSTKLVWVD